MSKAAVSFGLFRAQRDAELVLERIRPHVVRAEVAGSIRRRRPSVHDIDLVVELDPSDPWVMRRIEQDLGDMLVADGASEHWRFRVVKEGSSIVSFVSEGKTAHTPGWVPFGPNLDLYLTSADLFATTLLIRTGSAGHNARLAQQAKVKWRKLAVSQGVLDLKTGRVIPTLTEADVFAALDTPYVAPEAREAPEFDSWVREEAIS